MIWIQGDTRPRHLGFPMHYGLALPDAVCQGRVFPAVLCLHGAGAGGGYFLKEARLEALVERYQLALILPDGRLSCFVDMTHGPAWGKALAEGLLSDVRLAFAIRSDRCGALGVGTGAFGAVHLSAGYQQHVAACAAIDLVDLTDRHEQRPLPDHRPFPLCLIDNEGQASNFVQALAQSELEVQEQVLPVHANLEDKLDAALRYLAAYLQ